MSRPLIGITIAYASQDDELFVLRDDYVRSLEKAGALPVVFAPGHPEDVGPLLSSVSGLMLTGGADVDPRLYGEERHPSVKRVLPQRDAFEIALSREALRQDLPVLAICRGQQVLNVATGGTLVQDLPSQWSGACSHNPDVERWATAHEVRVVRGTRLHAILGSERVAVNSFHHQAVKELGRGLIPSAHADDGVIEGIESGTHRFVVGVQWHPEAYWDQPQTFQSLFESLVRAATR